ncbi:MAG: 4,5-dihydroxyphthalate decarboxylase [Noviherbaspirillum sp.]|nr:4,5-dihydroxyphthalate decarboxylase [Noviherbaspirillum sp.]
MGNIQISLAVGDYDHVRDLLDGSVRVEGADLTVLRLPSEEITYRFVRNREWDVSKTSFGNVISLASQDDRSLVAIPVFPSRMFRHSSIYVLADGGIERPEQLAGKRIGMPEWAQTASIYARGMLTHEYGVDLSSIHWHQGGVNQPGREEKVRLDLPPGMRYTVVADRSLSAMLLAGELDAVISARPPAALLAGDGRVRRLFENYRAVELAYWKKTGIYPIMNVITIRREIYERHRWLAMNLFKSFEEAKNRSLARMLDGTASYYPLPWMAEHTAVPREMLGADFWPYGVEANRATLEAFTRYAFEQGVCHRKVEVEEMFAPEVLSSVRV